MLDPYNNNFYGGNIEEDYDSLEGDVESRGATRASSTARTMVTRTHMNQDLDNGRHNMHGRNAHQQQRGHRGQLRNHRQASEREQLSPDELMNRILRSADGEDCFSVNTGRMCDAQTTADHDYEDDGRTFDASTIATNPNNATFNAAYGGGQMPMRSSRSPFLAPKELMEATQESDTGSTASGGNNKKNNKKAKAGGFLCLSGKCWLILALLVALGVIAAGVIWFVLFHMPSQQLDQQSAASDSSSTAQAQHLPCCNPTEYDPNHITVGNQICDLNGKDCCRVCPFADGSTEETSPVYSKPETQKGDGSSTSGDQEEDAIVDNNSANTNQEEEGEEDADVLIQQKEEENPPEVDQFVPQEEDTDTPQPTPVATTPQPTPGPTASPTKKQEEEEEDPTQQPEDPTPPPFNDPVVPPPPTPEPTTSPVTTDAPTPLPTSAAPTTIMIITPATPQPTTGPPPPTNSPTTSTTTTMDVIDTQTEPPTWQPPPTMPPPSDILVPAEEEEPPEDPDPTSAVGMVTSPFNPPSTPSPTTIDIDDAASLNTSPQQAQEEVEVEGEDTTTTTTTTNP